MCIKCTLYFTKNDNFMFFFALVLMLNSSHIVTLKVNNKLAPNLMFKIAPLQTIDSNKVLVLKCTNV